MIQQIFDGVRMLFGAVVYGGCVAALFFFAILCAKPPQGQKPLASLEKRIQSFASEVRQWAN